MTVYTGFIDGDLHLHPGDDAMGVTRVRGWIQAYGNARIDLPACTSVGSVFAYDDSNIALPACKSFGLQVEAFSDARIDLPACTEVGSLRASGSASISLPACTAVGEWVSARGRARIDLPACTAVEDWVVASDSASIDLSACTKVGGEVRAYASASIALPDGCLVGRNRDTLLPGPWVGPLGEQLRMARFFRARDGAIVTRLGCFRGTIPDAVAAIREKYGEGSDYEQKLVEAAAKIATGN